MDTTISFKSSFLKLLIDKYTLMQKRLKIVKKGEDSSNQEYWLSLSANRRMAELEKIRQEINKTKYGNSEGLQRVYRIIKHK